MPQKILMVCLGNICRSPLAEGILQSKLPKDKFIVESAGTGEWHVGKQPDARSIAIADKKGLDISRQRGRLFKAQDFGEFDYIYVMDGSNYNDVLRLATNAAEKNKVKLILNELFTNENVDLPDPFFCLQNGFESVYDMLDQACDVIAKKKIKK